MPKRPITRKSTGVCSQRSGQEPERQSPPGRQASPVRSLVAFVVFQFAVRLVSNQISKSSERQKKDRAGLVALELLERITWPPAHLSNIALYQFDATAPHRHHLGPNAKCFIVYPAFGGLYGFCSRSGTLALSRTTGSVDFRSDVNRRNTHSPEYSIAKLNNTQIAVIGTPEIGANVRPVSFVKSSIACCAAGVISDSSNQPFPSRSYLSSSDSRWESSAKTDVTSRT